MRAALGVLPDPARTWLLLPRATPWRARLRRSLRLCVIKSNGPGPTPGRGRRGFRSRASAGAPGLTAAASGGKLRARRAASPGATPGSRAARRCPGPTPCSAARPPDGRGRSERHLQGQLRVQRLCRRPTTRRRTPARDARDPGLRLVTPARRGRRRASAEAGPAPSWERRSSYAAPARAAAAAGSAGATGRPGV